MAIVGVLAAEIGVGAFLDRGRDLDHPLVAGRTREHLGAGDDAVEHGDEAAGDGNESRLMNVFPVFLRQTERAAQARAARKRGAPL